jgi:hypothetical protein
LAGLFRTLADALQFGSIGRWAFTAALPSVGLSAAPIPEYSTVVIVENFDPVGFALAEAVQASGFELTVKVEANLIHRFK